MYNQLLYTKLIIDDCLAVKKETFDQSDPEHTLNACTNLKNGLFTTKKNVILSSSIINDIFLGRKISTTKVDR